MATLRDDLLKAEPGEAGRSVLRVEAEGRNVLKGAKRRAESAGEAGACCEAMLGAS
jgi:hypothetical protein